MTDGVIAACSNSLRTVDELGKKVAGTWADLDRLCFRLRAFSHLVSALKDNPAMMGGSFESEILIELDKVLTQNVSFIKSHLNKSSYKGFTDIGLRDPYIADLAKHNHVVARLAKELNVTDDLDFEHVRDDDYQVKYFAYYRVQLSLIDLLRRMHVGASNMP